MARQKILMYIWEMTYSVLYLCHDKKIIPNRICPKNQFCTYNLQISRFNPTGNRGIKQAFWHFLSTSISLCKESIGTGRRTINSRRKNCFYSETPEEIGNSFAQLRKPSKATTQLPGGPNFGRISKFDRKGCQRKNKIKILNLNITLTAKYQKGFLMFTSCLSLQMLFKKTLKKNGQIFQTAAIPISLKPNAYKVGFSMPGPIFGTTPEKLTYN